MSGVTGTRSLVVNQPVTVDALSSNGLASVEGWVIRVGAEVHVELAGRPALEAFGVGTAVQIRCTDEVGFYYGDSTVLTMKADPPLSLVLSSPKSLTYVQRREHFRVETEVRLTFRTLKPDTEPTPSQPGKTVDLSGGGMQFRTEAEVNAHDRLAIDLALPGGAPVQSEAEVTRSVANRSPVRKATIYTVGVKFVAIDERERDRVIRYLFHVQLQERSARRG